MGFSTLQGRHQLAQKSMIVIFPNTLFKINWLPSGLRPSKNGAICPTSAFGVSSNCFLIIRPELVFFIRFFKDSILDLASSIGIVF